LSNDDGESQVLDVWTIHMAQITRHYDAEEDQQVVDYSLVLWRCDGEVLCHGAGQKAEHVPNERLSV
jgi:hypothetical protein